MSEFNFEVQKWQCKHPTEYHLGNGRAYFRAGDPNNAEPCVVVLQEAHYYPFGLSMTGLSEQHEQEPTNKYQYNGKELTADFGLHWNDYGARWQDPAVARWWSVDPLAEKYYWSSSYTYVLDNPLIFVDPNGKEVDFKDENAEKVFNETKGRIEKRIASYENKIKNSKKDKKTERLQDKKSKLEGIKQSFDDVINSETVFEFSTKPVPEGFDAKSGGGTGYNPETGRVEIWFYEGLDATLVHETRHAAGFERKEWGADGEGNPTHYDYQDEFEGYKQANDYAQILYGAWGRSDDEIRDLIREKYGKKDYIIKKFQQIKVE